MMKQFRVYIQRALCALAFFLTNSCTAPCRQWLLFTTLTQTTCFNSGRLYLSPDTNLSYLELEINRSSSGLRMYLNLLLWQAPPSPENPEFSCIDLVLLEKDENEEEQQTVTTLYAYRLEGGQKLWILPDDANTLIERLLKDQSFILKIGRYQITVIADEFQTGYQELMQLPIARTCS